MVTRIATPIEAAQKSSSLSSFEASTCAKMARISGKAFCALALLLTGAAVATACTFSPLAGGLFGMAALISLAVGYYLLEENRPIYPGVLGLHNQGNSCWFNASFQGILWQNQLIKEFFLKENQLEEHQELCTMVREYNRQMGRAVYKGPYVATDGNQQDASEYLTRLNHFFSKHIPAMQDDCGYLTLPFTEKKITAEILFEGTDNSSDQTSQAPPYLTIQINRFENPLNEKPRKINKGIDAPMQLEIEERYVRRENYALVGFVVHKGGLDGGHYFAYAKREGYWYLCNDSSIEPVEENDIPKAVKQAYILQYEKEENIPLVIASS